MIKELLFGEGRKSKANLGEAKAGGGLHSVFLFTVPLTHGTSYSWTVTTTIMKVVYLKGCQLVICGLDLESRLYQNFSWTRAALPPQKKFIWRVAKRWSAFQW